MSRIAPFSRLDQGKIGLPALPDYSPDAAPVKTAFMNGIHFSKEVEIFHGRKAPETGIPAGYGAIIKALNLAAPVPRRLALISQKRRRYDTADWLVFTPRHQPDDTLHGHLVFAIKYEGINLLIFKRLFEHLAPTEIEKWIIAEPLSRYNRKIWFLYEWLTGKPLTIPDLQAGNYIPLLDEALQYVSPVAVNAQRYRIRNNLPGTVAFCPLIHKTPKLESSIQKNLSANIYSAVGEVSGDVLLRTAAFLLLKDSKASFAIEGEAPTPNRAARWGQALGEAGSRPLSKAELLRLQEIIIDNKRFTKLGFRTEGGFVGEHDHQTGAPLPDHISARPQDIEPLLDGLIATTEKMARDNFHPVLAAALVAFGFVFIHPFVDGNGRLHRYLIHHILASMHFTPQGMIFPVSASILDLLGTYRIVLESHSHPLLQWIKWRKTADNNVEVLNPTADLYRYFDATAQAEFLFDCIDHTIREIIPAEMAYLQKYHSMKTWLDTRFQMPDKTTALLIRFLAQNNGALSQRAKEQEFAALNNDEVKEIESRYRELWGL
jgi:Fic family protein